MGIIQDDGITESFGDYIKYKRENKGLTLKEVAQKAGISTAYLSKLENSKRKKPSLRIIKKLAYGLEVSVINLLLKSLKINQPEVIDIRDVILEGNYIMEGKEVSEEARVLLYDMIKVFVNDGWKNEKKVGMLSEELLRKVKYLNHIL